jgi:hypothetical protein
LAFKAVVSNCSILRITDPLTAASEYHGLIEIQPAKAAMRAIDELNGRELNGKKIEARRYYNRSLLRDRLQHGSGMDGAKGGRQERRRINLKIELVGN